MRGTTMLTIPPPPAPARTSFDDGYEIRRHAAAGQLASIPGDVGDDLMHRIETHGEIVIDKATARALRGHRIDTLKAVATLLDLDLDDSDLGRL